MTLCLDEELHELAKTFAPHHNVLDGAKPYSINGFITLLTPANALLSDALDDDEERPAEDSVYDKLHFIQVK